jgi:peptidoglycan/xylan/chitin deacetylase (PgdA/CDA1 family)
VPFPAVSIGSLIRLRAAAVLGALVCLTACTHTASPPAAAASVSPSPSTEATPSATAVNPTLAAMLAKLPHFGPAPRAVPIALPAGPDAQIFFRLPVTAPVAFLTMDDGLDQLPVDLTVMKAAHVPFTMFLIAPVAAKDPAFFTQLVGDGGVIEDHTMTHPDLRGKPYAAQQSEICEARTLVAKTFGKTPTLFRPPFGDYDTNTLKAVHDCGLLAAFHWSETVDSGIVRYQTATHKIRAGDILLMHFRPTFVEDVVAALTAIYDAGLTPALLEDYVTAPDHA